MLPSNPIETMDVYASNSQYINGPSPEQQAAGTVPLDTLPADWWNWLWKQITERINQASEGMEDIYDEIMSVLTAASIEPSQLQSDQLLNAVKALTHVTGTAAVAGAVKSSAEGGKVSIDENGIMTVNGLGIPSSLNTTAKNVVDAINEILLNYTNNKTTIDASIEALQNGKAPTDHASEETTYGAGTASTYGHVKLSDSYNTETPKSANESVGASQKALALAYEALKGMIESSGGLPTHLADNPMLNASAGESGIFTVSEEGVGFYYLEMKGGTGGNGGTGTGKYTHAGGKGSRGETLKTVTFLFAGTYNYIVGTNGGNGATNGAGGSAGTGYSLPPLGQGFTPGHIMPRYSPYSPIYGSIIGDGGGRGQAGFNGGKQQSCGGGGGGGGTTAFYKEDAPALEFFASGGSGGIGGRGDTATNEGSGYDAFQFPGTDGDGYLKIWKLV